MDIYKAPVYKLNSNTKLKEYLEKYQQAGRVQSKRFSELEKHLQSIGFAIEQGAGDVGSPSRGRESSTKPDFAFKASAVEKTIPAPYKKDLLKTDKYGYRGVRKNSNLAKMFEQSILAQKTLEAIAKTDNARTNMRFEKQDLMDELYQVEIQGLQNINGEFFMHVSSPEEVAGILEANFTEVDYNTYVDLVSAEMKKHDEK